MKNKKTSKTKKILEKFFCRKEPTFFLQNLVTTRFLKHSRLSVFLFLKIFSFFNLFFLKMGVFGKIYGILLNVKKGGLILKKVTF